MDEPNQPEPPSRTPQRGPLSAIWIDPANRLPSELRDRLDSLAHQLLRNAARDHDLTGELRARILDDQEMIHAHNKHLGLPTTTDILTFNLSDQPNTIDADLDLCIDQAKREAAERNIPLEHELLLYLTHGLLHCIGFDDHDPDQYQKMHAEEDRLLQSIGLPPIFNAPHPTPQSTSQSAGGTS